MPARVAFVGAGNMAGTHFDAVEALVNLADVVGVCDLDAEARARAAARFGCRAFKDYRRMFDSVQPQAVYVIVPPFAHGKIELEAAERGIHLFVEKPVSLDLETALKVRAAVEKSQIFTAVGYHWRYSKFTRLTDEFISAKKVGLASGHWTGAFPTVQWWRRRDQSGGQMVEQSTHIFDLCRHYLGEPTSVYARHAIAAEGMVEGADVPDVGIALVEFETGALAQVTSACLLPDDYRVELSLITSGGVAELSQRRLRIYEPGKLSEYTDPGRPYQVENEAFLKAVLTGDASDILTPYADAVKTLRLTLAAVESADTGQVVDLSAPI